MHENQDLAAVNLTGTNFVLAVDTRDFIKGKIIPALLSIKPATNCSSLIVSQQI